MTTERVSLDQMLADLKRLGWRRWKGHQMIWVSPAGQMFRGPYLAWCIATGKGYIYAR